VTRWAQVRAGRSVVRSLPLPGMRLLALRRPGRGTARAVFPEPGAARVALAVRGGRRARVRAAVRAFTAAGGDLDAPGTDGTTLLVWALLLRRPAALAELLAAGADPARTDADGPTVVHLAAAVRDPRHLAVLLDGGADPDVRHAATGETPLARALLAPTDAQFRALLAAGADPGAADDLGHTPLHRAAALRRRAEILALVAAGADPAARTANGTSFPSYLRIAPAGRPDWAERTDAWLREHGLPLEGDAPAHG